MTLSDAIEEYHAYRVGAGFKPSTLKVGRAALSMLLREVGNLNVRHLDVRHGEKFQTYLTAKYPEPNTVNTYMIAVRGFVDWAHKRRYIPQTVDPLATVRRARPKPSKKLYVEAKEFEPLLESCATAHERIVTALGLYLFLRQGEIATLKVGDVNLDRGEIEVTVWKGDGQIDTMPICEELDAELRIWLKWYAEDLGDVPMADGMYLVPRRKSPKFHGVYDADGNFVKYSTHWRESGNCDPYKMMANPHKLVQYALAGFGMEVPPRQGNHTLRRSGARAYFDQGLKSGEVRDGVLREVMAMLHHKNSQTTEIYLGLKADTERRNERLKGRRMFAKPDTGKVITLHAVDG